MTTHGAGIMSLKLLAWIPVLLIPSASCIRAQEKVHNTAITASREV